MIYWWCCYDILVVLLCTLPWRGRGYPKRCLSLEVKCTLLSYSVVVIYSQVARNLYDCHAYVDRRHGTFLLLPRIQHMEDVLRSSHTGTNQATEHSDDGCAKTVRATLYE